MKIRDAYKALAELFRSTTIPTPDLDARLLLAKLCDLSPTDIRISEQVMTALQLTLLAQWQQRRLAHEPVGRIIGERGFWTLDLDVTQDTLEPRPDTETLVELVLATFSGRRDTPLTFCDLGTGSGAIVLSLLSEWPHATALATDMSFAALQTARGNAVKAGLQKRVSFVCGHWMSALNTKFDVIVSNPPYIPTAQCAQLAPNVRNYDPLLALNGGADGLRNYRLIAQQAQHCLKAGGCVSVEIGHDQNEAVTQIFASQNFTVVNAKKDLGGHVRALIFSSLNNT